MRIGIDARLFGPKNGGIGRYSQEIIKQLEELDSKNQYFVFLQADNFNDYQPQNKNFQKVLADYRPYSLGEQLFFPKLLRKHQLALVHFLHFNVPIFYGGDFIVTIHDLIISHYPQSRATTLPPLVHKVKLFFYHLIIKAAARKAKKIIAVSQYTKDDIVKLLKTKERKIEVIYEGVDLPLVWPEADCQKVLVDLKIGQEFLLYVGSAYPHKNLENLILAFSKIGEAHKDLQLVLVGKNNYFYQRLKEWAKKEVGEAVQKIIFTDYLDDQKLACLYRTASLYVFPSLIEGFGLPPLEAQNYGLAVVSSDRSCLPEILGDSAVYFDPENTKEIAEKINSVLTDKDLRQGLIENGTDNLKKYSWRLAAERVYNLYFSEA
ncbi:MAG: glycosyltransferase family 1 protein [Patescibacteria group bacterium]